MSMAPVPRIVMRKVSINLHTDFFRFTVQIYLVFITSSLTFIILILYSNAYYSSILEIVLKARVANVQETDFIEIELPKSRLSFELLFATMCRELMVDRNKVMKIRKLPDTIIRKDKDVMRLKDFQEMELVLTSKAASQASRGYGLAPQPLNMDIVY